MKKSAYYYFIAVFLAFMAFSCTGPADIKDYIEVTDYPEIFPDYRDVVILGNDRFSLFYREGTGDPVAEPGTDIYCLFCVLTWPGGMGDSFRDLSHPYPWKGHVNCYYCRMDWDCDYRTDDSHIPG